MEPIGVDPLPRRTGGLTGSNPMKVDVIVSALYISENPSAERTHDSQSTHRFGIGQPRHGPISEQAPARRQNRRERSRLRTR